MERLNLLGLNPNESACFILYIISILWFLYLVIKPFCVRVGLLFIEIVLIIGISATLSRGAILVLICMGLCLNKLNKWNDPAEKQHTSRFMNWILYSSVWRIVLVFCNPDLWMRTVPAYVAKDASILNRFELWRGALKLISSAPLRGWGYHNTGASYMNWFQKVDNYTYYNGLVNSYLQIGAAWGLMALFGLLFILFLGIISATILARENNPAGTLCLLLILVWAISSLFSSMLASPLLFFPPLIAAFCVIISSLLNLHPDQITQTAKSALTCPTQVWQPAPRKHWPGGTIFKNPVCHSLAASFAICLLLFTSGRVLAFGDSMSISYDEQGVISIAKRPTNSGRLFVIYVDEEAIGRHYGKEVRKFLLQANLDKGIVITRRNQIAAVEKSIDRVELVIMSGVTVTQAPVIRWGTQKYVLLRPAFMPKVLQCESIQSIIWPEIDRGHPLRSHSFNQACLSKVHIIPFNENFETSWSKYINI